MSDPTPHDDPSATGSGPSDPAHVPVDSAAAPDTGSRPADVAGVPVSAADTRDDGPTETGAAPTTGFRPRRSTVVLGAALALTVIAAGVAAFWFSAQLSDSRDRISEQEQQIQDQKREIEEQRDMIERKEQFGAAMADLYTAIDPLVGLPYASVVPWTQIEAFADRAWGHRWTPAALERDIADVEAFTASLADRTAAAQRQAASNASGSPWEATLDDLGRGWVTMTFDETNRPCGMDVMACVSGGAPFIVHVSADTRDDPQLTDWIRTGVAYHEYAHVLQFANPEATASALTAFAGDVETMADCYALTVLDGWSLEHEVPIDEYSYWEVSVGYGYTCNDGQKQVIRDWVNGLGVQMRSVGA